MKERVRQIYASRRIITINWLNGKKNTIRKLKSSRKVQMQSERETAQKELKSIQSSMSLKNMIPE